MRAVSIECFHGDDPLSARDHTLLMLGLFAGLRTGELHRLRWRDIPRTG